MTATELGAVLAELSPQLRDAEILDVALLQAVDDLLLVLRTAVGKAFLHLALGGARARLCLTTRRWPKTAFAAGPKADLLRAVLAGGTLLRIDQTAGERRCAVVVRTAAGEHRLICELFGSRGLWALLDPQGIVRELPHPVVTAVRTLRPGDLYSAPPPAPGAGTEPPPRFADAAACDRHFTAQDLAAEQATERDHLRRLVERAQQKTNAKIAGLQTQLADTGRSAELRAEADLMLAYAHAVPRGATSMVVPDPMHDDQERTIGLDPARPVHLQAQARYERARRLDDGRAIAEQRLAAATTERQTLDELLARLAATGDLDAGQFADLRARLQQLHLLPKDRRPSPPGHARARERVAKGQDFRRFVSAEGYTILVGKNNEQNDQLTLRVAAGNDLWLHVGGGRPGSHVVVRLPKGKTASLETLLDAGTLAIHFSKARGERLLDVIYTQKKHVRKPKGLPAGAVVPAQTRTITVRLDEERLRRLLASGEDIEDA